MSCYLAETKLYMHVQSWSSGDRRGLAVARRWDMTSAIASVDKQEGYHFPSSLIWDVERYLTARVIGIQPSSECGRWSREDDKAASSKTKFLLLY